MHYDYLVVGAGLFGAVFAQQMVSRGKKCLVIDKRSHVGGNIYTKRRHGIEVHKYGAHIFHTDDEAVWQYVNSFAKFDNFINEPLANYDGELYNLPFNMNTFAKMWNISTPSQAKEIIERQASEAKASFVSKDGEPSNLEEQALSMVGRDVYEKLIKGYTQKQWGRECRELPASIIKRIPLRFEYNNNYYNDRFQGIPAEGYTSMINAMLEGTEVLTSTEYKEFVEDNSEYTWDRVLYTGMIDEFFDYCLGHLEYRSLRFEEEYLPNTDDYQSNAVINYTQQDIPYTRIIEHKHFADASGEEHGKGTIITREYPQKWQPGDEPYYPVNDEKNNALYDSYCRLAEKREDIIFAGRLGSYKYYDMDKVVEAALLLSSRL